jgi:hypothetical protein
LVNASLVSGSKSRWSASRCKESTSHGPAAIDDALGDPPAPKGGEKLSQRISVPLSGSLRWDLLPDSHAG